jgi:hypothetical protein
MNISLLGKPTPYNMQWGIQYYIVPYFKGNTLASSSSQLKKRRTEDNVTIHFLAILLPPYTTRRTFK